MKEKKQWIQGVFDRSALEYGGERTAYFGEFGRRLVELSGVTGGQSVLDVATGKGAVLFPAAQRVGPTGRVVGVDISTQMLDRVRIKVETEGLSWVNLQLMDAEALKFEDDTFDVVFCGFALFFFLSIKKALSEFRRVLKPGGTLAVTTWGKKDDLSAWVNLEAQMMGATKSLATTKLFDPRSLKKVLKKARFNDVRIQEETKTFWYTSPEEWWLSLWEHGTRARLEALSSEDLEKLKSEAIEMARAVTTDKGVSAELQVIYGLGLG